MKPELLKRLAEALGHEIFISDNGGYTIVTEGYPFPYFTPESNPAQREEVLLWLLGGGWSVDRNCENNDFLFLNGRKLKSAKANDYTTALLAVAEKELENE